jgi:hypothetical protein
MSFTKILPSIKKIWNQLREISMEYIQYASDKNHTFLRFDSVNQ